MALDTAVLTGLTGKVELGATTLRANSVSLSCGTALLPANQLGLEYEKYVSGLKNLSGSLVLVGSNDYNLFTLGGSQGTLTITLAATVTISFPCVFGSVSVGTSADGLTVATATFAFAGTASGDVTVVYTS